MQTSLKLGEEIRNVRKTLNYEQKDFAKLIGVSNVHLSNLENGKKLPSEELLTKIWSFLEKEVPEEVIALFSTSKSEARKGSTTVYSSDFAYKLQAEGNYNHKKLKELLKQTPSDLTLIFAMLNLLKEEGKTEEAREHLLQSLIHIKQPELRKWLEASYFLLEKNFEMAIELMQKALDEFEKNVPALDDESRKRKSGLLFELSNVYYEYAYHSYNHEDNKTKTIENFYASLKYQQELRKIHSEPYYELYYANIFWWLAFLKEDPGSNWRSYIDKAENVLLINHEYSMRNSARAVSGKSLYSEPFLLQIISGLAEAYAQLAKLELETVSPNHEKINYLLKQGELLLAQHSPVKILPEKKEYYNFYFSYACFYALKAEIKNFMKQDYNRELELCSLGLQKAVLGDNKNKTNRFYRDMAEAQDNELKFFIQKKPDDFKYIKDKNYG